jgi:hypothetical protein
MAVLHAGLAWLAAASVVGLLVVAAATAMGRLASYRALDLAVLTQLVVTGLAALAGAATAASTSPPADPLHLVYGALDVFVPIGVRAAVQGRDARAIGRWVTVAALVAVGATLRSFMTGS